MFRYSVLSKVTIYGLLSTTANACFYLVVMIFQLGWTFFFILLQRWTFFHSGDSLVWNICRHRRGLNTEGVQCVWKVSLIFFLLLECTIPSCTPYMRVKCCQWAIHRGMIKLWFSLVELVAEAGNESVAPFIGFHSKLQDNSMPVSELKVCAASAVTMQRYTTCSIIQEHRLLNACISILLSRSCSALLCYARCCHTAEFTRLWWKGNWLFRNLRVFFDVRKIEYVSVVLPAAVGW